MKEILFLVLLFLAALFLILLILVQRGKGGGLAGAFGGMGGQSAFGTKAGDLFTKITIGVAFVWIVLCIFSIKFLGTTESLLDADMGGGKTTAEGSADTEPSGDGARPGGSDSSPSPAGAESPKSE